MAICLVQVLDSGCNREIHGKLVQWSKILKNILYCILILAGCSTMKSTSNDGLFRDRYDFVVNSYKSSLEIDALDCKNGDELSCHDYGINLLATSEKKVAELEIQRRCSDGERVFCFILAKNKFARGNIEEGEGQLKKLCNEEESYSCTYLGVLEVLKSGFGNMKLERNAYFEKACELNNTEACVRLEFFRLQSNNNDVRGLLKLANSKPDLKRHRGLQNLIMYPLLSYSKAEGKKVAEKFCKEGNIDQCFFLQVNSKKDESMTDYYCNKGSGRACSQAASMANLNHNEELSFSYNLKACALDDTRGCSAVFKIVEKSKDYSTTEALLDLLIYKRDTGGSIAWSTYHHKRKQLKEAIPYYKVTCYMNFAGGCHLLADIYKELKDLNESANYYKKSCELNFSDSCVEVAKISRYSGDLASGMTYFKKACSLKNFDGCIGACRIEADNGNSNEAVKFFEKACSLSLKGIERCQDFKKISKEESLNRCKL